MEDKKHIAIPVRLVVNGRTSLSGAVGVGSWTSNLMNAGLVKILFSYSRT